MRIDDPVAFGDRDATRVRATAVWRERTVRADEKLEKAVVAKSIYVRENARSTRTHTLMEAVRGWEVTRWIEWLGQEEPQP